jgi:hypothetical protein
MKTEKFQLRGNNTVCAGEFQILRSRAPAQFRGNIEHTTIPTGLNLKGRKKFTFSTPGIRYREVC